MSGTVRGLPVLTPVRGPASDDENTAFHEGLKAWKKAEVDKAPKTIDKLLPFFLLHYLIGRFILS